MTGLLRILAPSALAVALLAGPPAASGTPDPVGATATLCAGIFGSTFGTPSAEPLAPCQWDMALIGASTGGSYATATGRGVTVGVIDSGIDPAHPDVVANLDLARSCSFIYLTTPTADPDEVANGDCSLKAAVQDFNGHGTHVASTIAAPRNGVGIAGVAPDATIVALKACTVVGYCFGDSVAAALRWAADHRVDVVNLSLFVDPWYLSCANDAVQRASLKQLADAVAYAQQRGVTVVAAAGNESDDLQHPTVDELSPDWPPGAAAPRRVGNYCRVAPVELPGVLGVSATGPVGYPGYGLWLASYSNVGMTTVDVGAPGGDYFAASGTVQDGITAAWTSTDRNGLWDVYADLTDVFPGLAIEGAGGARWIVVTGTSMASPHATGVAALVIERHPSWSPGAVAAAVERTATPLGCPPAWLPQAPDDPRRCTGGVGHTSFFGHGLVNAAAAAES